MRSNEHTTEEEGEEGRGSAVNSRVTVPVPALPATTSEREA